MKNLFANLNPSISQQMVNLADQVTYRRPSANRTFDQIFMHGGDMIQQTMLMHSFLSDKDVLFLGDGDGMSMMFGLFATQGLTSKPKSLTVLDFDERMVNNIDKFSKDFEFSVPVKASIYNVIDKVDPDLKQNFDFFYINPPYGSKNKGLSTIAWLHRCMELCKQESSGCLVIPYDENVLWTVEAMRNIQDFLIKSGFVIRDMVTGMHSYHLPEAPGLTSATLIVDRVENTSSEFEGHILPKEYVINLYGKEREIPKNISDDGTIYGYPNYDWIYGTKFW